MTPRSLAIAAACLLLPAAAAHANCPPGDSPTEVCAAALADLPISPALHEMEAGYQVGDTLPAYQYNILFNPQYYGLPPVDGYWRYYRVNGEIFRVHAATMEILEQVTAQSAMLR
ncbi:hypothetical protein ACFQXB_13015 [Plastorhodobacter daqingensis]|uniref:Excinuclease ABC subunit A n=1 Tax=Plastorhodobacter daqingensis TaxID=1387281 RepID=A0ABW2ULM0_9RHOB